MTLILRIQLAQAVFSQFAIKDNTVLEFNILLPVAGFAVGVIVGMTGVGGGALMTPALIFGLGVTPVVAVGTDLIFAGITKSIGVYAHRGAGNIDWPSMQMLAYGSIPATIVSIIILRRLPSLEGLNAAVLPVLGFALLLTALVVAVRGRITAIAAQLSPQPGPWDAGWIVLSGAVLGGLVTLSSVGAGALGVAVLMIARPGMELKRIVGTNLAHALPLALIAGAGHWTLGTVDIGLLLALLVGSIPGIYMGSSLTGRVPDTLLRGVLATVLLAAGLMCIF